MIGKLFSKSLDSAGRLLIRLSGRSGPEFRDIRSEAFWNAYELCKPYTMTSVDRMYALYNAVHYVVRNRIPGDFVECGVWRGGSAMLIAKALSDLGVTDRKIYLYDTFEGMSAPSAKDVDFTGRNAQALLDATPMDESLSVWCLAGIEEVRRNMARTQYPTEQLVFVPGKVEDTIPEKSPHGQIALLRLDTDWYASTKHELIHLFPKLTERGIMIIDDYGHWQGCREAVDEYFAETNTHPLLHRIDYTGRLVIKTTHPGS